LNVPQTPSAPAANSAEPSAQENKKNEPSSSFSHMKHVPTIVSLLGIYTFAVGFIYLFGYWWSFDINVLEYMALSDVVKYTAFPVWSFAALFVFGIVIGAWNSAEATKTEVKAGHRHWMDRLNAVQFIIGGIFIAVALLSNELYVQLVAVVVVIAIGRFGVSQLMRVGIVPWGTVSGVLTFAVLAIPVWSYAMANFRARGVLDGTSFFVLKKTSISTIGQLPPPNAEEGFRYIGRAGGHLFLLDPASKSVLTVHHEKEETTEMLRMSRGVTIKWFRRFFPANGAAEDGDRLKKSTSEVHPSGPNAEKSK
jgi:hypothetical protein